MSDLARAGLAGQSGWRLAAAAREQERNRLRESHGRRTVRVTLELEPPDELSAWDAGLLVADAVSGPLADAGIRLTAYQVGELAGGRDIGAGG